MLQPGDLTPRTEAQARLAPVITALRSTAPAYFTHDPATCTINDLKKYLGVSEGWRANLLFMMGDHWQGGAGWSGPRPGQGADPAQAAQAMQLIQNGFCSQNVIAEVAKRHQAGLIGRVPDWAAVPTEDIEDLEEEERAAFETQQANLMRCIQQWWDDQKLHTQFKDAVLQGLWGERAAIRLYIPQRHLVETPGAGPVEFQQGIATGEQATEEAVRTLPAVPFEEALGRIYAEVVPADQARVVPRRDGMPPVGVYVWTEGSHTHAEITWAESDDTQDEVTIVRQVGPGYDRVFRLPLSGHLVLVQAEFDTLITEQVRQLQRLANKALTMMSTNMDVAGFLERIFLNAEVPFEEVIDASAPSGKRKVYKQHRTGPFTTNYIAGIETEGADGSTRIATPTVVFRDPIDPEPHIKTHRMARLGILQEVNQLHIEITGDAATSGESRRQAAADYLIGLLESAIPASRLGRGVLMAALRIAEATSTGDKPLDGLRIAFSPRLNTGPIPESEARMVMEQVKNKLLSRVGAMAHLGVEDIEAELDRIDDLLPLERWEKLLELLDAGKGFGEPLVKAMLESLAGVLGIDVKEFSLTLNQSEGEPGTDE